MGLVLSEEQELLRKTARQFVEERAPVSALRALRDARDERGFSQELWREMAELGWAGIPFPEECGGADLGLVELGIVLEECGRTLAATPLVSSVLVSGSALLLGASEAQRRELLPAIAAGERLVALAYQEGAHHAPQRVTTRAAADGDGFRIDGSKTFVLDGHVAETLLVSARTRGEPEEAEGVSLFLVEAGTPGLRVTRTHMVDSRNAAGVSLDGVRVGREALLGELHGAGSLLDAVFARAAAGLAAEMLGTAEGAFARTLAYLKEREQFGVAIGSFQALRHRAARMFVQLELSRSLVLEALQSFDGHADDADARASAAKAQLCGTLHLIGNESVQMHGGIGVTDEEDIGLFLKRARVAEQTFGDAAFHRDRYASLRGF